MNASLRKFWPLLSANLIDGRGGRRLALALGLGVLGALAFEPFKIFPLLLISYAGFVLLLDGAASSPRRWRSAWLIGWAYGFGFFFVGLHWIAYAFLVDAAAHAWQLPFVAVLFPAGLGLFFAAAAASCMFLWRPGAARIFFFASVVGVFEWLRGHVLTGLPWNLPAYGWGASPAILQSTSIFGVYGLSLLTLLFGACFAMWPRTTGAGGYRFPAIMTGLFIALWAGGEIRLFTATQAMVPDVHLRIVQPNTPQGEKYAPSNLARNWRRLIELSLAPASVPPTHIIWPEAAPPFVLRNNQEALADIAALTGDGRVLLTGDVRIANEGATRQFYNSFAMFGPRAELLGSSDKFHLVPFGEYLPLEPVLKSLGLSEIAASTGFSSGDGPKTFSVPGAPPVGPLICYEVIFPREVTGEPRPSWLVNLTDDSWFGPNAGPMQHLLIARVRAIEEGLPIIRAANGGISAIIDAHGRVVKRLDLELRGIMDGELPVAIAPTPFSYFGDVIVFLLFFLCGGAVFVPYRRLKA